MNIAFKTKSGILFHGDCIDVMTQLSMMTGRVDMILADLPYGTTQNKWDSIIPLDKLWNRYTALIKQRGAIVLTAQTPFDKILGASNIELLKYEWIWHKTQATGHLNARKMPMKNHENVLVFYAKLPTYNPQLTAGEPYGGLVRARSASSNYGQQRDIVTENDGFRYPLSIQTFKRDKEKLHPTQKPLALFEYMIKTYTNPGDVVLDNVMGSGTTAIACEKLGRKWIGIEQEEKYINIIIERLKRLEQRQIYCSE
jgi:site-specific DNA-methyltransferase (adenine-specific)